MDPNGPMPVLEQIRMNLFERGHAVVPIYGAPDSPAMDVGVVPVEDVWAAFMEVMGPTEVPCLYCYAWGHGEACLSGDCRDVASTETVC